MATTQVVETVAAKAADVWKHLSDFGGIQPGGIIESCEVEGEGVGMVRTLRLTTGVVVERLDVHDADQMTFAYSIINDECPLPVSNYSATVKITADPGGEGCTVDWTGEFEPKEASEDAAVRVVRGIYTGAIQRARDALGV